MCKLALSIFLVLFSELSAMKSPSGLEELEKALAVDFKLINYPPLPLRENKDDQEGEQIYDVVIIGAGMAGLAAGAALFQEGIFNIMLFDENTEGIEGPWRNYARMKTLRSEKEDIGPALGIPHLTFQAWYEAQHGTVQWNELNKIPTQLWMEYLVWFRRVMQLPVVNESRLTAIFPNEEYFILEFKNFEKTFQIKASKVVLATGRKGFGGPKIPGFAHELPKEHWAHVAEQIDFKAFQGKKIGVVGGGSSALDAAATGLEARAAQVDLLVRSPCLPCVNKFASLPMHCFQSSFYYQPCEWRWKVMNHILNCTVPPPIDSLKRVQSYSNFNISSDTKIVKATVKQGKVELETNKGMFRYDFIIFGTGFEVNIEYQPELKNISEKILLWKDQLACTNNFCDTDHGNFPFLGPSFEFMEKIPHQSPYLKNIYCFNYASLLSHGRLSTDIHSLSIGAKRLAEGIARDFIQQQSEFYLKSLESYNQADFNSFQITNNLTN